MDQRVRATGLITVVVLTACASPMERAVSGGRPQDVAVMLGKGERIEERMGPGALTPLELAADRHRVEVAKLLIERGADINARRNGTSALTIATLRGDREMVELLLANHAKATPRDVAYAGSRPEIAALLKAALPAPTTGDVNSQEPVEIAEQPDDVALVIGIQRYMDAPEAPAAERDAASIRTRLKSLGWPERNIVALTGEQAGRAALTKFIERWLPRNINDNSRLWIHFSGDGALDMDGHAYLLPYDGEVTHPESTGYAVSRLLQQIKGLPAKAVIVVIDARFTPGLAPSFDADAAQAGPVMALFGSCPVTESLLKSLDSSRHPLTVKGALTEAQKLATCPGVRLVFPSDAASVQLR